jgi:hypothetical protein
VRVVNSRGDTKANSQSHNFFEGPLGFRQLAKEIEARFLRRRPYYMGSLTNNSTDEILRRQTSDAANMRGDHDKHTGATSGVISTTDLAVKAPITPDACLAV